MAAVAWRLRSCVTGRPATAVGPPVDPAPEVHGMIRTLIIKRREKSRRPRSGNDDPATERSDDTAGDPELRHGPLRSWVPPLIPLPKCME